MNIGTGILLAIFLANVFVTFKIVKRKSLSNISKVIRIILIWLFPFVGLILAGGLLQYIGSGDGDDFDYEFDFSDSDDGDD